MQFIVHIDGENFNASTSDEVNRIANEKIGGSISFEPSRSSSQRIWMIYRKKEGMQTNIALQFNPFDSGYTTVGYVERIE